jgi:aspartate racemase
MKLGIIGGLGPLATAYYYELLTTMSEVSHDQDHLEIVIHSCPQIPDRTKYILNHEEENPLDMMIEVAQGLENQGVDLIGIPCITASYFHTELSHEIHIPIIHLIEEVCDYLQRNHIECVGIMATDGTIEAHLFQDELEKRHIRYVIPYQETQKDVMHLIYQDIKLGHEIEMDRFQRVSDELFDKGAQVIILGCTELPIIKKEKHLDERYLDVLEILAAVSLQRCQMKIKDEYRYLINKGE